MNLLDLYENREPYQQAIDKLEHRRIEDLEARMDDCARRGDVAGFRKAKEERDSYHRVKELDEGSMKEWLWKQAELLSKDQFVANADEYGMSEQEAAEWWDDINGVELDEKLKGLPSKTLGTARDVGKSVKKFRAQRGLDEGEMKRAMEKDAERMSREAFCKKYGDEDWVCEFWDNVNGPMDESGIGHDIVNKQEKMARATPSTPTGKVASTVKNAAKWLAGKGGPGKEGPTYESAQKKNSEKVKEERARDLAAAVMLKKAHAAFPSASNDAEALALWIADKEQRDVNRLEKENEQEEAMIARIMDQLQSKEIDEHGGGGSGPREWHAYVRSHRADEGWSDAIVAQRTGRPRTPYSVFIKGKKWKDFENEDHAENVANKLRAKFKAEGRDPSVITIAPTDYDKGMDEAANPAQQAAIAIAMKKAGKKPKHVDEAEDQVDPIILKALERLQPGLEGSRLYSAAKEALALEFGLMKARGDATFIHYLNQLQNIYSQRHSVKEDIGSWIVYDPETKQIRKRFKTHTAGKSYAQTHRLGFASSEYYFDNIKPQAVAEARPISKPEDGIMALKKFSAYLKKNIVDLASMADFESEHSKQPYVDERFEGFLSRADGTPITPIFNLGGKLALVGPNKEYLNIPTEMYYRFRAFMYGGQLENDLMKILGYTQKGIAEVATDYQKRRQRERDVDMGKPVAKQRQPRQTDYQKRRAEQKRQDELGEEKTRLDPKCWKGKKIGNPKTKMKGGVRVNNCVPAESINEGDTIRVGAVQPGTAGYDAWRKSTHKTTKSGEKTPATKTTKSVQAGAGKQHLMPRVVPEDLGDTGILDAGDISNIQHPNAFDWQATRGQHSDAVAKNAPAADVSALRTKMDTLSGGQNDAWEKTYQKYQTQQNLDQAAGYNKNVQYTNEVDMGLDPDEFTGLPTHVTSQRTVTNTNGVNDLTTRGSSVTGPTASGDYRVRVTQGPDKTGIASDVDNPQDVVGNPRGSNLAANYTTKTPPQGWMVDEQEREAPLTDPMNDPFQGLPSSVKTQSTLKQTNGNYDYKDRTSSVTGPNTQGEYNVTVTQFPGDQTGIKSDADSSDEVTGQSGLASNYITKNPPKAWMQPQQISMMKENFTAVMESRGITDPKLLEVARKIDLLSKSFK